MDSFTIQRYMLVEDVKPDMILIVCGRAFIVHNVATSVTGDGVVLRLIPASTYTGEPFHGKPIPKQTTGAKTDHALILAYGTILNEVYTSANSDERTSGKEKNEN